MTPIAIALIAILTCVAFLSGFFIAGAISSSARMKYEMDKATLIYFASSLIYQYEETGKIDQETIQKHKQIINEIDQ